MTTIMIEQLSGVDLKSYMNIWIDESYIHKWIIWIYEYIYIFMYNKCSGALYVGHG